MLPGFHNGFGIELKATADDIAQIEYTYQDETTLVKSLEAGQAKAVFILWQDGFSLLPGTGGIIGVNTTPSVATVSPYELKFSITTAAPVDLSDFGITSLVTPSYFGTKNDVSVPANGDYYKTATGLPWAIHIGESFDYPVEKMPIISAYNYFAQWAQSGGVDYPDWFMDIPGYRVGENIYP